MTNNAPFEARLIAARKYKKLSQEALAKRADMSPGAISHFETGKRKPSLDNLRKLADALKVTADFLLGRTDDMDGLADADFAFRHGFENLTLDQKDAAMAMFEALGQQNQVANKKSSKKSK